METATLGQGTKLLALLKDVPREQIQALLASGLLTDLCDANIAEIDRNKFREFLGLKSLNPSLLEELGTVTVPATTEPFVVHDKCVVGNVGIVYVGEQFKAQFLGKIEKPIAETTLRYAKLVKPSVDSPILTELGDKAETTLAQIFALVKLQANGEGGVLLTNGWANIFYVRDINGELWAVGADWRGLGWRVGADSVADPRGWRVGRRVFSRNS